MRFVGRLFGLMLIFVILVVTPCAFWAFNIDRVAMNPQTYKTAMNTQNFYGSLVPALVDGAASDSQTDPQIRAAARSLVENISLDEWATLSDRLLPPSWLQDQVNGNIDRLFAWINGERSLPDIHFDLKLLKTRLSSSDTHAAVNIIVPKLPNCTADQERLITAGTFTEGDKAAPLLCNPESDTNRKLIEDNLTTHLITLGEAMPDTWRLIDQLQPQARTAASAVPTDSRTPRTRLTEFELARFRGFLWLDSRLIVLLFLVPLGLFALIIMVTIRSRKQFFQWLGWGLILSGIITLLPVPFMSGGSLLHPLTNMQEGLATNGQLIGSLIGGMASSIVSGLTLAVLIQVAVVIGVGFVAVIISVLLPVPEPEVSLRDVMAAQMGFTSGMGSTPRPFGSTPMMPFMPTPTPPPAPPELPDPLADLFPTDKP
ncbi:MAG: hypothetical protein ABI947_17810 [Chloroflexota bacterium]